jgi:diadenosine tetraphosphate (Ap4A) HIT family hydrolase
MITLAQKIGAAFPKAGLKSEAYQLHMNNGSMVQRVQHAHLHIYPRYRGDFPGDSVIRLAADRKRVPRSDLDALAAKLKSALE